MDTLLVLQGDYDKEGLEIFKQTVRKGKNKEEIERLPFIASGPKEIECPNPDCPCKKREKIYDDE